MEPLAEVVVDRKILGAFRQRAASAYPREIIEQVVGRIVGNQARIYAFRELEHEATRSNVIMDEDANPMTEGGDEDGFDILGTIHTHIQNTTEPSELDWNSMHEDFELLMGICAIRKTAKRRFVSFSFFSAERVHLQLTISEREHPPRRRRAATSGH